MMDEHTSEEVEGWAVLSLERGGWRRVSVGSRLVVGSGPEADLRIARPGVSSRQCRLRVSEGVLVVTDLGGQGACTVAGQPLTARPRPLQAGEVLRVAGAPLVVVRQRREARRWWVEVGPMGSGAPAMWAALAELCLAAPSPWPVLLTGETGTGKELAARLTHDLSEEGAGPLVTVNCAALNAGTLQAELFGARRGAYTGSVGERVGAFEQAHHGTLFLDEVGELPLEAQAALLRVLENGEIQVVGGEVRQVQVRVVAATNRPLEEAVAAGRFRLDLLHRLGVARVHLPPLRSRGTDARRLLRQFCGDHPLPEASSGMIDGHSWPGNVRELKNAARRLMLVTGDGPACHDDVVRALRLAPARAARPSCTARSARDEARLQLVAGLLQSAPGTNAAWRQSGLARSTFFRLLRALREGDDAVDNGVEMTESAQDSMDHRKGCRILDGAPRVGTVEVRSCALATAA